MKLLWELDTPEYRGQSAMKALICKTTHIHQKKLFSLLSQVLHALVTLI